MANELNTTGKLLEYSKANKTNKLGTTVVVHTLTFALPDHQVTGLTISSVEYQEMLFARFGVEDMTALVELLKTKEVPLYFNNNDNFAGYSLTEPFKSNNFPNMVGLKVLITDVEATNNSVTFELEDGTIGNRKFTRQIGADANGNGGEWYADPQKKIRFIKSLEGLDANPLTYDLNDLKGYRMDYAIATLGSAKYLDVLKVYPASTPTDSNSDFLNSL